MLYFYLLAWIPCVFEIFLGDSSLL